MIIKRTFKYRLKLKRDQQSKFAKFAGSCRFLYNFGLNLKKSEYEKNQTKLSYYDLNNKLPNLKKEHPWLKEIHSQILQQSLKDLDQGFQHFFRRLKNKEKPGYPKFRRKGEHDSFRYPQGFKVNQDQIYLPKIGWTRFIKSREIKGAIKQVTIIKEGNHWYVCFSCKIDQKEKRPIIDRNKSIGIDVGILNYTTMAIGAENKIEKEINKSFLL